MLEEPKKHQPFSSMKKKSIIQEVQVGLFYKESELDSTRAVDLM